MHTNSGPARPDHESDPAHTPEDGWGEEGGASHLGPATHVASGHSQRQKHAADEVDEETEE